MSTIVYQGTLQSCFESQIIETTTLKLKVPSTIEFGRGPCIIDNNIDNHLKEKCNYQVTNKPSTTTNPDLGGGWSFLQNLSNNISKDSNLEKESGIYVHPLSKRSSYASRLSEKSLQLCTESLGSETGTDIIDSNIFSFSSSSSYSPIEKSSSTNDDHGMTHQAESSSTWSRTIRSNNNKKSCSKFPPPLTTIRGLNSMQIRPHREDGRLIIKAVEAPLTNNYLHAERSNGRLRLSFFKDEISASNFEENEDLEETESEIRDEEEVKEEEIEEKEDDIKVEEEEEESDMHNMKWDIDGNKFDVEGEMGKEKCQRLSRCKESGQGNKVFCDWRKALWVATS
ncbi:protein FANTASTIC FOUR 3 [Lycium barbarum]|uniref:protein FANTASTIC FOUR 3 n=1 Tax=Lycium barbarum TaxID=112863 RepID=UPI00293F6AAF|nr:protein FANTASTIC FOUR 3 [Lycium barbarum]